MTRYVQALRAEALRFAGAEEGVACPGTALESSAFKVGKKTFLFLRAADLRLKLRESLPEAEKLAGKDPGRYEVGSLGWVKVKLGSDAPPSLEHVEKWIGESYRLAADPPAAKKKAVKKRR